MQISITNGTLTQIQETLTANSGYTLPNSISVIGATSNYNSTTGVITLTNLTQTMSITAIGELAQVNNISIGTLKLAKAFIGNSEISQMWLGNVKIYEKEIPIALANFTLSNGDYLKTSDNKYFNIEEEN